MSLRRACRLVEMSVSSYTYAPHRHEPPGLRERLKELATERPRWGYRNLHWTLGEEGFVVNHKQVYRIYREENLMVRRRGRRRLKCMPRTPLKAAKRLNERWSMDFVSDAFRSDVSAAVFTATARAATVNKERIVAGIVAVDRGKYQPQGSSLVSFLRSCSSLWRFQSMRADMLVASRS